MPWMTIGALAVFTAGLIVTGFHGRTLFKSANGSDPAGRWLIALSGIVVWTLIFEFGVKISAVVFDIHSWIRFQKTFVLASGFPLYYGAADGPALATIYGPVSVLAYLPATLVRDPKVSIRCAAVLAALFYFLPVFWIHRRMASKEKEALRFAGLAFCCFAFWSFLITSLRYAAFTVHADAPALGLAAFACGFLILPGEKLPWKNALASALCAVLAVWAKQVAVPVVIALPLFVWIRFGTRSFLRYLSAFLITGLGVSAVFLLCFDARNMLFQMFEVPSRHGFKDGGAAAVWFKASSRLFREILIMAVFSLWALGALWKQRSKAQPLRTCLKEQPWTLFVILGVAMIPLALLSNIKVGGSNNTISFANYFFLIAATGAFVTWHERAPESSFVIPRFCAKPALALMSAVLLVIGAASVYGRIATYAQKWDFAGQAFAYIKAHPGKAYFPRLTLLHLLGEGKVYHTVDGLMDRHWAGMPVSEKHLRRYMPPELERVAFSGENHMWLFPLAEFPTGYENDSELPGFYVYPRREKT